MTVMQAERRPGVDQPVSDGELVKRVLAGELDLFELIMRRYNQRLYRVVRSILGNDADVEHVMQDAYVAAYTHLGQFAERSKFSTWLTKIAVYEALARKKRQKRLVELDSMAESEKEHSSMLASNERNPEEKLLNMELKDILEHSVEALPELYRSVFVMREIEGLDTVETAECLGISQENVKTRLHRAKAMIRGELHARTGSALPQVFDFHLSRCDRLVAAVIERIKSRPERELGKL